MTRNIKEKNQTVASNDGGAAQSPDINPTELLWDELDEMWKQSKQAQHISGHAAAGLGWISESIWLYLGFKLPFLVFSKYFLIFVLGFLIM